MWIKFKLHQLWLEIIHCVEIQLIGIFNGSNIPTPASPTVPTEMLPAGLLLTHNVCLFCAWQRSNVFLKSLKSSFQKPVKCWLIKVHLSLHTPQQRHTHTHIYTTPKYIYLYVCVCVSEVWRRSWPAQSIVESTCSLSVPPAGRSLEGQSRQMDTVKAPTRKFQNN